MSHSSKAPPPPHALLSLRSPSTHFLLVLQSIAHSLAYSRLGAGKSRIKIVEQARKADDPVLVFGTINVMREMDLRHPAALLLQEMVDGHHKTFGVGCTTMLALVGLFANNVTRLMHSSQIPPVVLASNLADIQQLCVKLLQEDDEDGRSWRISFPQIAEAHRRSMRPPVPSSPALIGPDANYHDADDDSDWFFHSAAASTRAAESISASAAASSSPEGDDTFLDFLSFLGGRLHHGQAEPMRAAVRIIHRLMQSHGIVHTNDLLRLIASTHDLTELWDLGATLTVQAILGSTSTQPRNSTAGGSDRRIPSDPASDDATVFTSRWELVEGVLLDLFAVDVSRANRAIGSVSSSGDSFAGVVLVLGDLALPDMPSGRSTKIARDAAAFEAILQANDRSRDQFRQ